MPFNYNFKSLNRGVDNIKYMCQNLFTIGTLYILLNFWVA